METKIKVGQLIKESEGWQRSLAFLSQENFYLKLALSDILGVKEFSPELLEASESYNSRFLQFDESIRLLVQEISKFRTLLSGEISQDDQLINNLIATQNYLRGQIKFMELEFNRLKFSFNNYLSEL